MCVLKGTNQSGRYGRKQPFRKAGLHSFIGILCQDDVEEEASALQEHVFNTTAGT